ncbi:PPOX class F420-dependent oxidoreductase [Micromonospora musae]|uniref:PPOX class F420-dependent oxidoreductase n=1 Tax=Micromonospora musae TaxID=1894970 RepID=A0A3A9YC72_9ACTN|nr:PPOX class F420-dependent oxidoreductase [Micromonospora musae]RKN23970.1 PPOX class F420-dependent oxidoreductase [Micromonospora musae]RKN31714.1 PPOX class F420-dependent oxidoreductase [Micromonospora musae]
MAILTDDDLALLAEPQLAHVATIEEDGSPHVTPVWIDTDGEHILFNTIRGRTKYENLRRNPQVAISVADRANDFRTLWIKGRAELVTEGADEHLDRLARKYLGQESYPFRQPGEQRVIIRVTPMRRLGRTAL